MLLLVIGSQELNALGAENLGCSHALVRFILLCLLNFSYHIRVIAGVKLHNIVKTYIILILYLFTKQTPKLKISSNMVEISVDKKQKSKVLYLYAY